MPNQEGNEELINLDNLDDSVDDFLSNKSNNFIEISDEKEQVKCDKSHQTSDTILNEEIDTQNLPASPPFTKVSAIKMFSAPLKKPTNPPRPKEATEEENKTVTLARKDHSKSFLPRIKKRQKQ